MTSYCNVAQSSVSGTITLCEAMPASHGTQERKKESERERGNRKRKGKVQINALETEPIRDLSDSAGVRREKKLASFLSENMPVCTRSQTQHSQSVLGIFKNTICISGVSHVTLATEQGQLQKQNK